MAALRDVLRGMNESAGGSKNELILRLNAVDPLGAWMSKLRTRGIQEGQPNLLDTDETMEQDSEDEEEAVRADYVNDNPANLMRELKRQER